MCLRPFVVGVRGVDREPNALIVDGVDQAMTVGARTELAPPARCDDALVCGLEVVDGVRAEDLRCAVGLEDAEAMADVGDASALGVELPAQDVGVEASGAGGVGRVQGHVTDVALMDLLGTHGLRRTAQHPPMPERVDDDRGAGAVGFVRLSGHRGSRAGGRGDRVVGVVDGDHQADRDLSGCGRPESEVRELGGEIDRAAAQFEFGVTDHAVGHHDRLAAQPGAECVDVPVDRGLRFGDDEIREGAGAFDRRFRSGGRLGPDGLGCVELCCGGHDDSFG